MGSPKAELKFGDSTLLQRIVTELARAFIDIVIVAGTTGLSPAAGTFPAVVIIKDKSEYEGPLLALARGLSAIRNDAAFVCSCDVPLLNVNVATALCAMLGEYDAVVAEIGGRPQPLHAVYRKNCVAAIDAMLRRGQTRLTSLAESVSTLRPKETELRAIDRNLQSFTNVNTPEEYNRALRALNLLSVRRPLHN